MSAHKWIDRICVAAILLSVMVTALFMNGEKIGIEPVPDTDAESYAGSEYFTANDLNGDWDASSGTVVTLNGDSAKISGNGAYWLDGSLVIAQSGQYVISGELTDGNIVVDAAQYSKVWILLCGVTLYCSDDSCIRVDQADKVFLTLAAGTENTLTGGDALTETALADGVDAVIFSHDDLTINGCGTLNIVSSYMNGITSKDDLIITGGTVSVAASDHGVRVNDRFRMTSADLTISADRDGIHSEGDIVIRDGTLTITAGDDAIHSDTSVQILGGAILVKDCYEGIEALTIEIAGGDTIIHSRDDGLNANGYTGVSFGGGMNRQGQKPEMSESMTKPAEWPDAGREDQANPAEEETFVSAENTWILISGGNLTVLNEDGRDADGIDSNGNITITGGKILVSLTGSGGNSALDSGGESGGIAVIRGGTIVACGDSSMAEGFELSSTQASILYSPVESVAAGSTVILLDDEGNELISETIPYGFSSLVISCPDMTVGDTYTIRIGEAEETIEVSAVSVSVGEASGAGMAPGNALPGGRRMGQSGFGNGETPPERPDSEEDFNPPDGGFSPPEDGPETSETGSAGQALDADNTFAWLLVLGSVLCLMLGLAAALKTKEIHIET